jgi:hypothetical protein
MKRSVACMLVLTLLLSVTLVAAAYAQVKKDAETQLDRVEGTVQSVNKEKSTIMVRQTNTTSTVWTVAYSPETKFTYRNQPATVDEVKDSRRVIVLGKVGAKEQINAARIDVRSGK